MRKIAALALALSFLSGQIDNGRLSLTHTALATEEKAETGASFVEMKPLTLPVVDGEGISQVISLVVSLEVENAEAKAEVEKLRPRLTDAYIQDMYGTLSRKTAMEGGVLQVAYIKERLNKVTAKVMGEHKVKDVLLQVIQQRGV